MDCHTETQIRGGFHRKLDAPLIVLYRSDWVACVATKRATNAVHQDGSAVVCYKHFRFRNQLVAQWAVFFDCLGIPYQYQPDQEFQAEGIPDFFLPRMDFKPDQDRYKGVFLEVKTGYPSDDEIEKANRLKDSSGRDVYLFYGSTFEDGLFCWGSSGETLSGESVSPAWIEQCPFCGEIGFSFKPAEPEDHLLSIHAYCLEGCKLAKEYDVMSWFLDCQVHSSVPDRAYGSCYSPMLDLAYEAAKSARLEDPKYSSELRGIAMATRRLKEQRLFCTHETMLAIRNIARALRADPNCPRYEDQEPWYVPHLAHLRSGNRTACPCYSCEHGRSRAFSQ